MKRAAEKQLIRDGGDDDDNEVEVCVVTKVNGTAHESSGRKFRIPGSKRQTSPRSPGDRTYSLRVVATCVEIKQ